MKIAFCTTGSGMPRGLATTAFIGAFAHGLASAGHDVTIVSLDPPGSPTHMEAHGFPSTAEPWQSPSPPSLAALSRAAWQGVLDGYWELDPSDPQPEWYFESLLQSELEGLGGSTSGGALLFYPRSHRLLVMASRVAARLGWQLVLFSTEALTDRQIDPLSRQQYIELAVERSDVIWTVSRHLADFWADHGFSRQRLLVSPPPVRDAFFGSSGSAEPGRVLYLGNLAHPEVRQLLQIASIVKDENAEFHLAVYGDAAPGEREALQAEIDSMGLHSAIELRSPVAPVDVPVLLQTGELLLLPRGQGEYSQAGFPNKLGEYLSSGRPVVVTAVGDIPVYLVDGEHARVVEPDDALAFAAAVLDVLHDSELAEQMGAAGRRRARDIMSAEQVARRLIAALLAVPARRTRGFWASVRARIRGVRPVLLAAVPEGKRLAVRVLRSLHLKRPAPPGE
jgi:glycosyltransferase involved in cell wall biosynthesis